jgi:hypothetical protein
MRADIRRDFVHALLADLAQPMGVPNEYVVEFFAPTLDHYEVIHNVAVDDLAGDPNTDTMDVVESESPEKDPAAAGAPSPQPLRQGAAQTVPARR